ncbi:lipopolysaccharide biosynthesis protein [Chishuiella sp.]|uniref:lipopolysaccharide biosynthesis protein n=1 Tax=Chishuiella sp. TaxID=1969467 RepID=UPI0028A61F3A|nr:oligosaccharide flippase family protein [Chishuiella sp.]
MKKNILGVLISNFLGAGLGFAVNIILARFLSVEEFGRINLLSSLFLILYSLFEFNFSNATVIFVNKNKSKYSYNELIYYSNYLFKKYYRFSILFIMISLVIINYFYKLNFIENLMLVSNFYLFSIYKYVNTLHQATGEWKKYNIINILNNICKFIFTLISIIFVIYFSIDKYDSIIIGFILFPVVVLTICLIYSREYIKIINLKNSELYKNFLSIIIPLGISNIFMLISMRFDSLIIEYKLGSEQLGIYSAANTLALMFPLITNALRNVLVRQSSVSDETFLKKILNFQKKYWIYLILILIITIYIAPYLFNIMFGEKYDKSILVFQTLIIVYIGGVFFTPLESFFYTNSPKLIRNQKLIQMFIIVFGSVLLIDYLGIFGVAISIVCSRIYGWGNLMTSVYKYENKRII